MVLSDAPACPWMHQAIRARAEQPERPSCTGSAAQLDTA